VADLEKTHVPDKEQELVEANILIGLLLAFLFAICTTCLDVPYPDWTFLYLRFHFGLLVNGLEESCFPPLYFGPDWMLADQLLQLYFFAVLDEVVSQREDHQHLRVVSIEL